ncbi:SCP2 sterol-binding domain-containing protein [Skermanella sp. TT6]|uniref:SCP2 sterol-binding domain-containing protein n=1 Tax=Skermanella cutis TaxID=2775420 RepID=A0ABX7B2A5_9PROT|nr:SCP2 sterol-binding domain-containing protein [Skermanella sp. TT6]QQP88301.1 SCP2 sterol-binding domain-containing protein [Skermanella sp. TT6]
MTLDQIEAKMRKRLPQFRAFNGAARFDFGKDGLLRLDATKTPATLQREDGDAVCTIRMTLENFDRMLDGDLNPTLAFATGKLKVQGSMGSALKLASLLEE